MKKICESHEYIDPYDPNGPFQCPYCLQWIRRDESVIDYLSGQEPTSAPS